MGETVRENGIETTGETKRTNARDARTTTGERKSGKGASKSRGNDEKTYRNKSPPLFKAPIFEVQNEKKLIENERKSIENERVLTANLHETT